MATAAPISMMRKSAIQPHLNAQFSLAFPHIQRLPAYIAPHSNLIAAGRCGP